MLNVQALTRTLSSMSLPQLQQYATLHKNDPYVVTMALSIANQKKQAMTAQQGMAGQQPMPKVVDQEIAQVAPRAAPMPEDVGIAQLPARNIQNMAGGGIVAFGDGGDVPRYNGTGGSFVGPQYDFNAFLRQMGITAKEFMSADPVTQNNIRDAFNSTHGAPASAGAQPATAATAATPAAAARTPTATERFITATGKAASGLGNYLQRGLGAISKWSPAAMVGEGLFFTSPEEREVLRRADERRLGKEASNAAQSLGLPEGTYTPTASQSDVDAMIAGTYPVGNLPTEKPAAGPGGTGSGGADASQKDVRTRSRTPASAAQPQAGVPGLITDATGMQKALAEMQAGVKPEVPGAIAGGISDLEKAQRTMGEEYLADLRAEQAARPKALENFEKLVNERRARTDKSEAQLGPMALLQAGLGIMSGTSPFAAVNIGVGAQVGVKAYTEGADKIERAREKMDEAYAKIEEVRRNESRMDAKEIRDAKQNIRQAAIDAQKLSLSALQDDWKLKRQDAVKGVELLMQNQRTLYEQAEQTKRTGMQIAAQREIAALPSGEMRAALMLGTGNTQREQLESGLRKMAEISQDKSGAAFAKLYATHLDESNKQGVTPMSADAYANQLQKFVTAMLPRVSSSVPSNATVRTQ